MSGGLRVRVAEQLERLNGPGGDLSVSSPRSTWHMFGDTAERLRVWAALIEEFLADQPIVSTNGNLAVVTAGPPGAGKSTAIGHLGDDAVTWRRIDPDRIKELLIRRAINDRTYEHVMKAHTLADGRRILPMELSGLVHEESVRLADTIRRRCLTDGEDVVVDGTLAWEPFIDVLLRDFVGSGYQRMHVLSVDVPLQTAVERALDRWWLARSDLSNYFGGRFVSRAVIAASYAEDNQALGVKNAVELAQRGSRLGMDVELTQLTGARDESESTEGLRMRRLGDVRGTAAND